MRMLISKKNFKNVFLIFFFLVPITLKASFIESTIGTAVVNDATATFYNPAALTLLKNSQLVGLGSVAYFNNYFTGQITQVGTGFSQAGSSSAKTYYYLPSIYLGIPANKKITFGIAVVANMFNRDVEQLSILRYVQARNSIQDIDIVPAVGVKFTDWFSAGAGFNFSSANFLLQPIAGIPGLNIPDNESHNNSTGKGVGGDLGILIKPAKTTLIGINYRSAIEYKLNGQSVLKTTPRIISDDYFFNFFTPARIVVSINQYVTKKLGFIGTVQRIQWSIFKEITIHGIATIAGTRPLIIDAITPYHFRDTWLFTLGTHYKVTPKWIIRVAGSYSQSPGNPNYQLVNGDSIILGASTAYDINKCVTIDGSYAHVFIQNQNIHIARRNFITGVNKGFRDSVSLKLTLNL